MHQGWRVFGAVVLGLCCVRTVVAAPISVAYVDTVTGWKWAQVNETTGLSWNNVASVCSTDGVTACTADFGGIELAGWTWATRDQVRDLWVNATDLTAAQLSDYTEFSSGGSTWGPQLLSVFNPTWTSPIEIKGWTATEHPTDLTKAYQGNVTLSDPFYHALDFAIPTKGSTGASVGVWLYQSDTELDPVPEPASLVLVGGGLAALCRRYRRRQQQS